MRECTFRNTDQAKHSLNSDRWNLTKPRALERHGEEKNEQENVMEYGCSTWILTVEFS